MLNFVVVVPGNDLLGSTLYLLLSSEEKINFFPMYWTKI